jgi:hypothetical protein
MCLKYENIYMIHFGHEPTTNLYTFAGYKRSLMETNCIFDRTKGDNIA